MRNAVEIRPGLLALPVGSRGWTAVVDYDAAAIAVGRAPGAVGHRTGFWCEDAAGGWGVGRTAERAVRECARPVTYRNLRDLRAALDEEEDGDFDLGYADAISAAFGSTTSRDRLVAP